jgi:hypothetical protein
MSRDGKQDVLGTIGRFKRREDFTAGQRDKLVCGLTCAARDAFAVSKAADGGATPVRPMLAPITQSELAGVAAQFAEVIARLRDLVKRSDPDLGASVEAGELDLDIPLDADVIDAFEADFQQSFIRRAAKRGGRK